MASIIAHGDLSAPDDALKKKIYVRPILEPDARGFERTPSSELLVDLIHRAFRRIFEGDGDGDPAAPSVRIVNLSIGDPSRVFVRRMSPLARLLDWLAVEYNVLIVVSGGNHTSTAVAVPAEVMDDEDRLAAATLGSLHDSARHRRLLSPAEAINVLTVGSLHQDAAGPVEADTVLDPVADGMPAPYSPVGFGFRRSVKPEVLLPGGRQLFLRPPPGARGDVELEAARTETSGPGVRVAAPGLLGAVDATSFTVGTSNSAALGSRIASGIFDVLEELTAEDGDRSFPAAQYHPVLAKTFVVHAAGWGNLKSQLSHTLGLGGGDVRRELTRILGYGPVDERRVANADRVRVVLLGAASIEKDQRHTYRFPLPSSLAASREWRRLSITLGWFSPVNVRSQKYRMARLSYSPPGQVLKIKPVEADHNAVEKGTVQHQVLEGDRAAAFVAGDELVIDVDCRCDAATSFEAPVRYGLVASLEIAATLLADIHNEVEAVLRQRVQDRAVART